MPAALSGYPSGGVTPSLQVARSPLGRGRQRDGITFGQWMVWHVPPEHTARPKRGLGMVEVEVDG